MERRGRRGAGRRAVRTGPRAGRACGRRRRPPSCRQSAGSRRARRACGPTGTASAGTPSSRKLSATASLAQTHVDVDPGRRDARRELPQVRDAGRRARSSRRRRPSSAVRLRCRCPSTQIAAARPPISQNGRKYCSERNIALTIAIVSEMRKRADEARRRRSRAGAPLSGGRRPAAGTATSRHIATRPSSAPTSSSALCATVSVNVPSGWPVSGVVVELEVAGPDAQQRVVGREPGGRAPRAEAGRDVLLGDLLLEHQRLAGSAAGCCGSRAASRPPRRARR